jgi:hypothetical protein
MKLWICDSKAKERWSTWALELAAMGWDCCLLEDPNALPTNEQPELLVIHNGDGWTWVLPSRLPTAQVIRYTGVTQDLVRRDQSGHPFCSLDYLQSRLGEILRVWSDSYRSNEWLFEMLGDTPLEAALELLHALLPPAINPAAQMGQHEKAWSALTNHVMQMKGRSDFSSVESCYERARVLYETCATLEQPYLETLTQLRDTLLSDQEPQGLIETITRARVA